MKGGKGKGKSGKGEKGQSGRPLICALCGASGHKPNEKDESGNFLRAKLMRHHQSSSLNPNNGTHKPLPLYTSRMSVLP